MLNEIPLMGVFKIIHNGELKTYNDYDKIPEKIDNVVSFAPYPLDYGDDIDQKTMNTVNHYKLLKLMEREVM